MKKHIPITIVLLCSLFFSCSDNNDDNANKTATGEYRVIFSGNITNAEAVQKVKEEIGSATREIVIFGTTQLTNLDLSSIKKLNKLEINQNSNLLNLNLDGLTTIVEHIEIQNNTSNINFNFQNLKRLDNTGLIYYNNASLYLSFPSLVVVNNIDIENVLLQSLSLPELKEVSCDKFIYGTNNSVEGEFSIENTSITTLNLPKLEKSKKINLLSNGNLSNVSIPLLNYSMEIAIWGNTSSFTSASVNYILSRYLTISPSNGKIIDFSEVQAPPTGQGIIDKNTLITNGNTVITNWLYPQLCGFCIFDKKDDRRIF